MYPGNRRGPTAGCVIFLNSGKYAVHGAVGCDEVFRFKISIKIEYVIFSSEIILRWQR
jgi:hypothetical protein